jgi:hypothetical protein
MIPNRKYSLLGARAAALIILLITSAVVVNATFSFTVPNAITYRYSLPAAQNFNVGISPSAYDRPILLMGTCVTVGDRGVGHVSLLRPSVAPLFLMWTGVESDSGAPTAATTSGFSDVLGTHIVYIDFAHTVDIEVFSGSAFRVHNGSAALKEGWVTMMW